MVLAPSTLGDVVLRYLDPVSNTTNNHTELASVREPGRDEVTTHLTGKEGGGVKVSSIQQRMCRHVGWMNSHGLVGEAPKVNIIFGDACQVAPNASMSQIR